MEGKVGASVARCPRTPPDAAKTPGLQIGISNRVTRPEQPEHSCRLQLWIGPITVVPCRAKVRPLRPRRSYFAPTETWPICSGSAFVQAWVEAPGTAPGSERFITTAIYRHIRLAPAPGNIGANGCRKKSGVRPQEMHMKPR